MKLTTSPVAPFQETLRQVFFCRVVTPYLRASRTRPVRPAILPRTADPHCDREHA